MRRAAWVAALALALSACSTAGTGGSSAPDEARPSPTTPGTTTPPVPAPIADLMEKTSMTELAKRIFLGAHPTIEGKTELQRNCRNTSTTHTLGCFLVTRRCRAGADPATCSVETRIHLLRIDRADVKDLVYVSAAHEMLHAAYEAMPRPERRQLDHDLESALAQLDQCRLSANMAAYSGLGGEERLSELHSILGTEFPALPAALQAHYSKYLANRRLVIETHDRTLGGREQEICGLRASLDQLEARLEGMRAQLQRLRSSGDRAAYNAQVPSFNAQVSARDRLLATHNRRVREYNQLLATLGSSTDVLQPRQAPPPPQ